MTATSARPDRRHVRGAWILASTVALSYALSPASPSVARTTPAAGSRAAAVALLDRAVHLLSVTTGVRISFGTVRLERSAHGFPRYTPYFRSFGHGIARSRPSFEGKETDTFTFGSDKGRRVRLVAVGRVVANRWGRGGWLCRRVPAPGTLVPLALRRLRPRRGAVIEPRQDRHTWRLRLVGSIPVRVSVGLGPARPRRESAVVWATILMKDGSLVRAGWRIVSHFGSTYGVDRGWLRVHSYRPSLSVRLPRACAKSVARG